MNRKIRFGVGLPCPLTDGSQGGVLQMKDVETVRNGLSLGDGPVLRAEAAVLMGVDPF
jgi:hypothetical protein